MEEEKIDRILKLVDMLEVTDENRDDIAKVKKLIEDVHGNILGVILNKAQTQKGKYYGKKYGYYYGYGKYGKYYGYGKRYGYGYGYGEHTVKEE